MKIGFAGMGIMGSGMAANLIHAGHDLGSGEEAVLSYTEIRGTEKPDEVVVVCGHLDSWHQATGTTDNGTGTASTLEVARILMAVGARPLARVAMYSRDASGDGATPAAASRSVTAVTVAPSGTTTSIRSAIGRVIALERNLSAVSCFTASSLVDLDQPTFS